MRGYEPARDLEWATALLDDEFGGRMQARRGELIDALGDGGLVAESTGRAVGLACWHVDPADRGLAEVTCLVVGTDQRQRGIGRALLDACAEHLRAGGATRLWLVTTNDNLGALRLYQRAGYRLTALRHGAVDESRRTIKPSIGEIGEHGIPIHDELELTLEL